MHLGIDMVSLVILAVGFVIASIRQIPARVRFVCLAASCGGVAGWRLTQGAKGLNLVFVIAAAVLAVWYLVRALRVRPDA